MYQKNNFYLKCDLSCGWYPVFISMGEQGWHSDLVWFDNCPFESDKHCLCQITLFDAIQQIIINICFGSACASFWVTSKTDLKQDCLLNLHANTSRELMFASIMMRSKSVHFN